MAFQELLFGAGEGKPQIENDGVTAEALGDLASHFQVCEGLRTIAIKKMSLGARALQERQTQLVLYGQ